MRRRLSPGCLIVLFAVDPFLLAAAQDLNMSRLAEQAEEAARARQADRTRELAEQGINEARRRANRGYEAEFTRLIGASFEVRGDLRTAVTHYEQALRMREELGHREDAGRLYRGLGYVYAVLREDAKAEGYLRKAIATYDALQDEDKSAQARTVLGQLLSRGGRLAEVETLLGEALASYRQVGNRRGVASAHTGLADLMQRRGEYRAALDHAYRSLDVQMESKQEADQARALDLLGSIYQRLGQDERALDFFTQARSMRQRLRPGIELAFSYHNVGAILTRLGRHPEALEQFEKALDIRRRANIVAEMAATYLNIGTAKQEMGNLPEAAQAFDEALSLAGKSKARPQAAMAMANLGAVRRKMGRGEEAEVLLSRAAKAYEELKDRRGLVRVWNEQAMVSVAKGDWEGARRTCEQAIAMAEALGEEIGDPAQLGAFRQSVATLYPLHASILWKLNRPQEALAAAERGRGAGLARMLARQGASFQDRLAGEDRKNWQAAAHSFSRAGKELARIQAAGIQGRDLDSSRAAYSDAGRSLWRLRDRLLAAHSTTRAGTEAEDETRHLADLGRLFPGTVFVEWSFAEGRPPLLFVVSGRRGLRVYELTAETEQLPNLALQWMRAVRRSARVSGGPSAVFETEEAAARELFGKAFEPVRDELARAAESRLVLVADGPLTGLPLPALMDASGKRLVDRFAVSMPVSLASLLQQMPKRTGAERALVVGDPLEGERVVPPSGDRYAPLAFARREAAAVAGVLRGSELLMGAKAGEAVVMRRLGAFPILHFATHGILSSGDGLSSALLLADEPAESEFDGLLHAWEIAGLPLSAQLAVLSACETAQGEERFGDGLIGLAWAFQAAGCPNVVASLWSVDDAATEEWMKIFYRELKRGRAMDAAMRTAMLSVRGRAEYRSPYFWAGFQLLGPGGTI